MPHLAQRGRHRPDALAGPAQGRFRVAARQGFDQAFQVGHQGTVTVGRPLPSAARTPGTPDRHDGGRGKFLLSAMDGGAGQSCDAGEARCAAVPQGIGFGGDEQAQGSLVEKTRQLLKPPLDLCIGCHASIIQILG
jgi:hypothetical protein